MIPLFPYPLLNTPEYRRADFKYGADNFICKDFFRSLEVGDLVKILSESSYYVINVLCGLRFTFFLSPFEYLNDTPLMTRLEISSLLRGLDSQNALKLTPSALTHEVSFKVNAPSGLIQSIRPSLSFWTIPMNFIFSHLHFLAPIRFIIS